MNSFEAVLFGIVQGVTEFLPVSSSGHTFLLSHYFGTIETLQLTILLHAASLLAVVIYFRKDILQLLCGLWVACREGKLNNGASLALKLGVATLLTVPVALGVEYLLPFDSLTPNLVAITLIITGALIIFSEYIPKRSRDFGWGIVMLLGLVQGLAVVPGISRSGLTIAFLIVAGLARKESARISFLLAIPTILGALIFTLKDVPTEALSMSTYLPLCAAFITSFIASLLSIKYMLRLVEGRWVVFAPYCVLLALAILLL